MTDAAAASVREGAVEFTSGRIAVPAVFARPEPAPGRPAPGMLVLHSWWGLNEHVRDIARRFAQAGFAAFAPDLYASSGGRATTEPAEAARLMEALSAQTVLRDLNAALRCFKAQPDVDHRRVAVAGFSMGGTFALTLACHNSDLKAAVVFYGKVPPVESLEYLLCPVLFHRGEQDDWVTQAEADRVRDGLAKFGKTGEVAVYPDAGHGFFDDTRPDTYRAEAAKQAWARTLRFLAVRVR
ncbi:MAG TPA: dienelactone hydrolase family protein [bacterium]